MIGNMWAVLTSLAASPLLWVLGLCLLGYGITWAVARRG